MRLFVAIELPDTVQSHLRRVQQLLRGQVSSASWTRQGHLHITLKFLGEVPEPNVAELCKRLGEIPPVRAMELQAMGLTCFPARGPIRVVAASFGGGPEPLRVLYNAVEEACAQLGMAREHRDYHAHTTLARPRAVLPAPMRARLNECAAECWPGPVVAVEQFVLMESRLRPEGAQYVPLAHFRVAGTGPDAPPEP